MIRTSPAPLIVALLACAGRAAGQPVDGEPVEISSVEESFEMGPELPGREKGDRERPAPEQEEAKPAEEPAAAREWFGHAPYWMWTRASGDWAGGRTWLEDRGVTFAGSYTLDWQSLWSAG